MKFKFIFLICIFLIGLDASIWSQNKTKPNQNVQSEMDKQMEEAMKDLSPEEKAEMMKMMGGVVNNMMTTERTTASYPDFNSNKDLIPKKDVLRIANIPNKKLANSDMGSYASNLYNKIMTKGEFEEITLIKTVNAKLQKANDLTSTAVLAMMQGHPQTAMALSMKAVQLEPGNVNMQNNMAALLTQYGYPEQAIPLLDKLKNEYPANSTVLNNLGQAWLALGELDSAKVYTGRAIMVNPFHPEAKVCGGLIEELKGDPIKAEKEYIEAMENSPNPIIEKILKNKAGDKGFEKIDFEKLKRSITTYEYFPKDWIKIPVLSDNVDEYESDIHKQHGYSKMFEELKSKLETMGEASTEEVNNLLEKGESDFIKTMAEENAKGINVMSQTAVTVQIILQTYIAKWMEDNVKDYITLQNKIDATRTAMTKSGKNDTCNDIDRKNSEFLNFINPLIREYHTKKIEELRSWLNIYCTWIWHMSGNPKNTVMSMCIGWTGALTTQFEAAISDQQVEPKCGVKSNADGSTFVATPEIPNFSCPTIVKVPLGKDWQSLSNTTKNFDANSFGIKQSINNPVPNHTTAFGADNTSIAEPGKAPFTQSANGSMAPGKINDMSFDELTPLKSVPLDELTPLLKKNLPSSVNISDADVNKAIDNRLSELLSKLLMKKHLETECNKIISPIKTGKSKKIEVRLGKLELLPIESRDAGNFAEGVVVGDNKNTMFFVDEKGETWEFGIGKLILEDSKIITDVTNNEGKTTFEYKDKATLEVGLGELVLEDVPENKIPEVSAKNSLYNKISKIITQISTNGLLPSINSGIQVPGTISPQKGLFQ